MLWSISPRSILDNAYSAVVRVGCEMTSENGRLNLVEATPDGPSLELLYRRHYAWLLKLVRHRLGPDQAEDLVQETYLRVSAYQGRPVYNPRALLAQIATRAAIDRGRRGRARPPVLGDDPETCGSADEQSQLLTLKQLVLGLPDPLRQVFLLSRFAGMTYQEIAAHCGISSKTVEWRMSKALKLLTRDLQR